MISRTITLNEINDFIIAELEYIFMETFKKNFLKKSFNKNRKMKKMRKMKKFLIIQKKTKNSEPFNFVKIKMIHI